MKKADYRINLSWLFYVTYGNLSFTIDKCYF